MVNKNRDSKFIIYQVLYIFVITVLALKGADLDLSRVVAKEKVVEKTQMDSLKAILDSLYALGINFDIKVNQDAEVQNEELKQQLAKANLKLTSLTKIIKEIPKEERVPEIIKEEEKPVEEQTLSQLPISYDYSFIQNTWNRVKNSGNVTLTLQDPNGSVITTIQPGEEKQFDLGSQSEIIAKYGNQNSKIKVLPNKPPEIKIERVTTKMSGSDIYVNELQRVTAFKVTIIDERPDQLKISPSGPISIVGPQKDNKGNLVYNVSLKLAANETKFDEWADRNSSLRESDGRYKAPFFFIAVDERTKQRVQVGDAFYFTEFSK
ncbi:MAG: hypothetical protein ACM3O3_08495 [Syntrophothermus sp.]